MANHLSIGDIQIGPGKPLAILAGPCVLEDAETNRHIAGFLKGCCQDLGLPLILKGSFDKANRTSMRSHRGPGIEEGLDVMASLKEEFGLPLTTDIHTPEQAAPAAKVRGPSAGAGFPVSPDRSAQRLRRNRPPREREEGTVHLTRGDDACA